MAPPPGGPEERPSSPKKNDQEAYASLQVHQSLLGIHRRRASPPSWLTPQEPLTPDDVIRRLGRFPLDSPRLALCFAGKHSGETRANWPS
jgi:hypothetical protein